MDQADKPQNPTLNKHSGSCHCGAIQFDVELDPNESFGRCNCSVCTKISPLSRIVKPAAFRLTKGNEAELGKYEWGAKISQRYFCKTCGVHCYGRGHMAELGGDFVGVNANCLDDFDSREVPVVYWDGRHDNWQAGPRDTPWPIARATSL